MVQFQILQRAIRVFTLLQICQRLEDDYNAAKTTLSELRVRDLGFNFDSVNTLSSTDSDNVCFRRRFRNAKNVERV